MSDPRSRAPDIAHQPLQFCLQVRDVHMHHIRKKKNGIYHQRYGKKHRAWTLVSYMCNTWNLSESAIEGQKRHPWFWKSALRQGRKSEKSVPSGRVAETCNVYIRMQLAWQKKRGWGKGYIWSKYPKRISEMREMNSPPTPRFAHTLLTLRFCLRFRTEVGFWISWKIDDLIS